MRNRLPSLTYSREIFQKTADALAVALAASLPWSTSATSILAVLWLLAIIPTFDLPSLRRIVLTSGRRSSADFVGAGRGRNVLGRDTVGRTVNGVSSFSKLLFIPLLLHHSNYPIGDFEVLIGFLVSCALLLATSWTLLAWPELRGPDPRQDTWHSGQRLHFAERDVHDLHLCNFTNSLSTFGVASHVV